MYNELYRGIKASLYVFVKLKSQNFAIYDSSTSAEKCLKKKIKTTDANERSQKTKQKEIRPPLVTKYQCFV